MNHIDPRSWPECDQEADEAGNAIKGVIIGLLVTVSLAGVFGAITLGIMRLWGWF